MRYCLLLGVAALAPCSAYAQKLVFDFQGSNYVDVGDVELARVPQPARNATSALFPFGPASPREFYSGPAFHLGYEVSASAPSDLTVAPDRMLVENNISNGRDRTQDTIALTSLANWPEANTYSVALAVIFPVKKFSLDTLTYSALNWTNNKSYNDKLRHRWLVQVGNNYYVNAHFLGRTGTADENGTINAISGVLGTSLVDRWVSYDPSKTIFAQFDAPVVRLGMKLEEVTEVGLYVDALDFNGAGPNARQWNFRLLQFTASGHETP